LSKIIGIGVSDSTVGPGVMEIITALLRNLVSRIVLTWFNDPLTAKKTIVCGKSIPVSLKVCTNKIDNLFKFGVNIAMV
jgi:hypothetical protein